MKPTDNQNRIFGPSGCISKEGMFLYLNDELNTKERNLLERHLADCLLCSEALEGYEKPGGKEKFLNEYPKVDQELKSAFSIHTESKNNKNGRKRTLITTISIAASLLIIITGYYLINIQTKTSRQDLSYQSLPAADETKTENQAALPEEKNTDAGTPAGMDKEEGKTKDIISQNERTKTFESSGGNGYVQKKAEISSSKQTTVHDISEYFDLDKNNDDEAEKEIYNGIVDQTIAIGGEQGGPGISDSIKMTGTKTVAIAENEQFALEETVSAKTKSGKDISRSKKENKNDFRSSEKAPESGAMTNGKNLRGISFYNDAKYKDAIAEFENVVKSDKNNFEAYYYLAMSYYNDGQKDAAMIDLDKVLSIKDNSFYDLALWQKAVIMTEKGQTGAARDLFNEIVKRGGALKNNAIQKVNELSQPEK